MKKKKKTKNKKIGCKSTICLAILLITQLDFIKWNHPTHASKSLGI